MILRDPAGGDSLVHRLDPRIKIIIALTFSIVVALAAKIAVTASFFVLAIAFIISSKPQLKPLLLRLALVNIFIIFIWLILPFSHPGRTVFHIGPLSASFEGLINALVITLKCNAIILSNIALLSTNTIFQLSHALRHLGVPDKIVHLFFLMHRYAFVIFDEYKRINDTLKIKGFKPKTNLFTYQTYAYIIANLLLKGHERSEQVYRAMICRGFIGKYWVLEHFSLKPGDIIFATVIFIMIAALFSIQWMKIF